MSEKEILKKAITKARKNGWEAPFSLRETFDSWWEDNKSFHDYYKLIFDLQFAKAFWGEGEKLDYKFDDFNTAYKYSDGSRYNKPEWQYHLQNMVISDNPIKYMEQYL